MTTPFTEDTLAVWMERRLGQLAGILEWTVDAGSFADMVDETKLALGVEDLTEKDTITGLKEVKAFAKVALWSAVVEATAGHYAFAADGGSFNRNQINEMAQKNLDRAMGEAMAYSPNWSVGTADVVFHTDHYQDHDDGLFNW